MKNFILFGFVAMLLAGSSQPHKEQELLQLWYGEPAVNWEEALPLGNGPVQRPGSQGQFLNFGRMAKQCAFIGWRCFKCGRYMQHQIRACKNIQHYR